MDRRKNVREGFRKKNPYFLWSFAKPGGGGSARVVKKPYCFFEKVFFQRACRIILVPPKHDLHLVWSPFFIYTAIRTALKVACKARILGKRRSISKNKKIKFWNGTKCKICFTHLWSYFQKKQARKLQVQATLPVRNYRPMTDSLTGLRCIVELLA